MAEQDKIASLSIDAQTITPDSQYDALSSVLVPGVKVYLSGVDLTKFDAEYISTALANALKDGSTLSIYDSQGNQIYPLPSQSTPLSNAYDNYVSVGENAIVGKFTSESTNAADSNTILLNKVAYVNGERIVGNLVVSSGGIVPTGTKYITTTNIYDVETYKNAVVNDSSLVSSNIRCKSSDGTAISILGINGTFTDPTTVTYGQVAATANDIMLGHSAWVDGKEIIGTHIDSGVGILVPLTVTPTNSQQSFTPSSYSANGFSSVVVDAAPSVAATLNAGSISLSGTDLYFTDGNNGSFSQNWVLYVNNVRADEFPVYTTTVDISSYTVHGTNTIYIVVTGQNMNASPASNTVTFIDDTYDYIQRGTDLKIFKAPYTKTGTDLKIN